MGTLNKLIPALALTMMLFGTAFGGGIVTNTNQSADFMRILNRNASTDLDAVYYNPAGLTQLNDGLSLYASNQFIFQTRTITTNNENFNTNEFEGTTTVPFYPNVYAAYKTGDLVLSAGLAPVGGGGSAEYDQGLPSFEFQVASLVGVPAGALNPNLAGLGNITGYSLDMSFEGSSVYIGGQAGASYALSDVLSVSAGLRYVSATNTYQGMLQNVNLETATIEIVGAIPDIEVDAERTGSGITGIFGVAYQPNDMINIGVKYETITKLEMENNTTVDGTAVLGDPMFPDGEKIQADIPAIFASGADIQVSDALKASLSFTYFLNTLVDWEGLEDFVNNGTEYGVGLEYNVGDGLLLSGGYIHSESGATGAYQTDLNFSINSNTLGLGAKYQISPEASISVGATNTFYEEGQNDETLQALQQKYDKTSLAFGLGVSYTLR